MEFSLFWAIIVPVALWVAGWAFSTIYIVFFDPISSREEKLKEWRGRLMCWSVLNLVLWPFSLPAFWGRRRFYGEMRSGKRPNWLVLGDGEETGRGWVCSDGTEFSASVTTEKNSAEPITISADFEDDACTGSIEIRSRMVAPATTQPTAWTRMKFRVRPGCPEPDDEDAVNKFITGRYIVLKFSCRAENTQLSFASRVVQGSSRNFPA